MNYTKLFLAFSFIIPIVTIFGSSSNNSTISKYLEGLDPQFHDKILPMDLIAGNTALRLIKKEPTDINKIITPEFIKKWDAPFFLVGRVGYKVEDFNNQTIDIRNQCFTLSRDTFITESNEDSIDSRGLPYNILVYALREKLQSETFKLLVDKIVSCTDLQNHVQRILRNVLLLAEYKDITGDNVNILTKAYEKVRQLPQKSTSSIFSLDYTTPFRANTTYLPIICCYDTIEGNILARPFEKFYVATQPPCVIYKTNLRNTIVELIKHGASFKNTLSMGSFFTHEENDPNTPVEKVECINAYKEALDHKKLPFLEKQIQGFIGMSNAANRDAQGNFTSFIMQSFRSNEQQNDYRNFMTSFLQIIQDKLRAYPKTK